DPRRGVVHLDARFDRAFCLLLQIFGPAVPELSDVEDCVERRRRIARPFLPAVTDRARHVVRAAGADRVTGVAADDVAPGKPGLEVQHPAELDLLRRERTAVDFGYLLRNGLEELLRGRAELFPVDRLLREGGDTRERGGDENRGERFAHDESLPNLSVADNPRRSK